MIKTITARKSTHITMIEVFKKMSLWNILKKLKFFPEVQRLIFLNLWATGLRISEVCTLKGDAYYWDGEDAWIKVYQIKMKAEKMIQFHWCFIEL